MNRNILDKRLAQKNRTPQGTWTQPTWQQQEEMRRNQGENPVFLDSKNAHEKTVPQYMRQAMFRSTGSGNESFGRTPEQELYNSAAPSMIGAKSTARIASQAFPAAYGTMPDSSKEQFIVGSQQTPQVHPTSTFAMDSSNSNVWTFIDLDSLCRNSDSDLDKGIFIFDLYFGGKNTFEKKKPPGIGIHELTGDINCAIVSRFHIPVLDAVTFKEAPSGATFTLTDNPGTPPSPAEGTKELDGPLSQLPFSREVFMGIDELGASSAMHGIYGNYQFEFIASGVGNSWKLQPVGEFNRAMYLLPYPLNRVPSKLTVRFRNPDKELTFPRDFVRATPEVVANKIVFNIQEEYQSNLNLEVNDRIYILGFESEDDPVLDNYINRKDGLLTGNDTTNSLIKLNPEVDMTASSTTIKTDPVTIIIAKNRFHIPLIFTGLVPFPTSGNINAPRN